MEIKLKKELLWHKVGDLIISNNDCCYFVFHGDCSHNNWVLVDLETKKAYSVGSVEEKLAEWNETIVKIIPAEKLKLMEI